ncbi:MAG: hypothetical protein WEE51_02045 [Pirellulaceae bacterium]
MTVEATEAKTEVAMRGAAANGVAEEVVIKADFGADEAGPAVVWEADSGEADQGEEETRASEAETAVVVHLKPVSVAVALLVVSVGLIQLKC